VTYDSEPSRSCQEPGAVSVPRRGDGLLKVLGSATIVRSVGVPKSRPQARQDPNASLPLSPGLGIPVGIPPGRTGPLGSCWTESTVRPSRQDPARPQPSEQSRVAENRMVGGSISSLPTKTAGQTLCDGLTRSLACSAGIPLPQGLHVECREGKQ
jgi:hypothetical protein